MSDSGPALTRPRPERRAARRSARRSPVRVATRAASVSAGSGVALGLLWWAVAPGMRQPAAGSYLELVEALGQVDSFFAVLCALAGAAAGVAWVLLRGERHDARELGRLVGLLVGGLAGAGVAWLTGWAAAALAPPPDSPLSTELLVAYGAPRFSAAVVAGALLWPLAVGLLVAVDSLREIVVEAWRDTPEDRAG